MSTLPAGTVTFLFSDIEGSTKLLRLLGPDRYGQVLSAQRAILRSAFETHAGTEIDTQGDSFFASFPRASDAVNAVVQIQHALTEHDWPDRADVHVRMGLHTGEPWLIEEGYVGMDVHRAARIAHVGHGGQVLLSETTTSLVRGDLPDGVTLLDVGRHRLKDMRRPEHTHQLVIEGLPAEFPPLTSLELIRTVTVSLDEVEVRPPRAVGESPYRGLATFREEDAQFFFGREDFTQQLLETLQEHRLVAVVVGSSGSGKSSTVFAGLLPELRSKGDWLILSLRPGTHPFHSLATALLPVLEPNLDETDNLFATQKIADGISAGEISLFHTINRVLGNEHTASRLLLILDQFEELYTLCPDPETRQAFIDELLAAVEAGVERRPNPVSILLTLRADFMGQALTNRPFADAMQKGSLLLGPMKRGELQLAIEKPAELQGAAFEPGLVTRILDDVGEEPGNLPLLEFALTLLWDQMDGGWLTHEVYDEIGRVEGALARYADEFYAGLKTEEQEQARRIFIQLVQPGQGTEDTRRVARRENLVGLDRGLIQHLADKRLVVTGLDEAGNETVEVVHEALIRGWGQLRVWMEADRAFRNWQEGLRVALRGWENSGKDEGALLRGAPLVQAEEWLGRRGDEIGTEERSYIQTSVGLRERRTAEGERRRRLIMGGLGIGLVVAVLLSIFAFGQRNAAQLNAELANQSAATAEAEAIARATQQGIAESERSRAEEETLARSTQQAIAEQQTQLTRSRELALLASSNQSEDPQLSLLLALEAVFVADTREAQEALHQAVLKARVLLHKDAHEAPIRDAKFSPDGQQLVTAGEDSTVKVWDAVSGELLQILTHEGGYMPRLAFDPNGSRLATIMHTGTPSNPEPGGVTVWEIETGEVVLSIEDQQSLYTDIVYSPDGERLAAVTDTDGQPAIQVWDSLSGEGLLSISGDGNAGFYYIANVHRIAYSPDGALLSTTTIYDQVNVYDAVSGQVVLTLDHDLPNSLGLWGVTFDPNGGRLATDSWEGDLYMWDLESGELIYKVRTSGAANSQFSPDGERLVVVSEDGASILDSNTGIVLLTLPRITLGSPVADLRFSPDGSRVVSVNGTFFHVWDLSPSHELLTISSPPGIPGMSSDGTRLARVTETGEVWVFDVATGQLLWSAQGHDDWSGGVAFSPDGIHLATGSDDGTIAIWDRETGEMSLKWLAQEDWVNKLQYSPDGGLLAAANQDSTVKVFDVGTGQVIESLSLDGPVQNLSIDSSGELLAAGDWVSQGPTIWELASGEQALELEDSETFGRQVVFDPDGHWLAAGSHNGFITLWDLASGEILQRYQAHFDRIWDVSVSPDGTRLATASSDHTARVWDVESGELIITLPQEDWAFKVFFTPDGQHLMVGSSGYDRFFTLDPDELVALAESRLTRDFTPGECEQYLIDSCQ